MPFCVCISFFFSFFSSPTLPHTLSLLSSVTLFLPPYTLRVFARYIPIPGSFISSLRSFLTPETHLCGGNTMSSQEFSVGSALADSIPLLISAVVHFSDANTQSAPPVKQRPTEPRTLQSVLENETF